MKAPPELCAKPKQPLFGVIPSRVPTAGQAQTEMGGGRSKDAGGKQENSQWFMCVFSVVTSFDALRTG